MTGVGVPDKSTLATYGGPYSNAYPVASPLTDQDAALANQMMADAAGMTRTKLSFWAVFTTASSSGAMTLQAWDATWAAATPTAPTLALVSTGIFSVTVPALITDELGVTHSVNFQRCEARIQLAASPTLFFVAPFAVVTPNVLSAAVYGTGSSPALSNSPCQIYISGG